MDSEVPKRPKPPLRTKAPGKRGGSAYESGGGGGGLSRRDMSSEYISSIVDRVPIPAPDDENEEENEFEVQRYTHRQGSLDELNDGRPGGELVIDEKPHFDSVSILFWV